MKPQCQLWLELSYILANTKNSTIYLSVHKTRWWEIETRSQSHLSLLFLYSIVRSNESSKQNKTTPWIKKKQQKNPPLKSLTKKKFKSMVATADGSLKYHSPSWQTEKIRNLNASKYLVSFYFLENTNHICLLTLTVTFIISAFITLLLGNEGGTLKLFH